MFIVVAMYNLEQWRKNFEFSVVLSPITTVIFYF